jgi:hypothetical protein
MELTREQAHTLLSIERVILMEWGISIGYSTPAGSFADESLNDFIVWEKEINPDLPYEQNGENNWKPYLLHREDFQREQAGEEGLASCLVHDEPKEFPQHEEETQTFWKRVQNGLASGELYHEPGITRSFEHKGEKIEVKVVHLADGRFSIDIEDNTHRSGYTRTLDQLREEVAKNEKIHQDPSYQVKLAEIEAERYPNFREYISKEDFKDKVALQVAEELFKLIQK